MDTILDRMDYGFESGFPDLNEKKSNNVSVKQENDMKFSASEAELDIKHDSASDSDILTDIENFRSMKNDLSSNRSFIDSDFKYILSKSPIDGDQRKPGKSKKESEEDERERMQVLVSNFTEDQLDRYEMFRRAAFPKASVKRIMQMITGNSVSQNVVIAMSGIAKVFIGEIVEEALDIMEAQNDTGPLQPKHLREAARRLRLKNKIPSLRDKKPNYRF